MPGKETVSRSQSRSRRLERHWRGRASSARALLCLDDRTRASGTVAPSGRSFAEEMVCLETIFSASRAWSFLPPEDDPAARYDPSADTEAPIPAPAPVHEYAFRFLARGWHAGAGLAPRVLGRGDSDSPPPTLPDLARAEWESESEPDVETMLLTAETFDRRVLLPVLRGAVVVSVPASPKNWSRGSGDSPACELEMWAAAWRFLHPASPLLHVPTESERMRLETGDAETGFIGDLVAPGGKKWREHAREIGTRGGAYIDYCERCFDAGAVPVHMDADRALREKYARDGSPARELCARALRAAGFSAEFARGGTTPTPEWIVRACGSLVLRQSGNADETELARMPTHFFLAALGLV